MPKINKDQHSICLTGYISLKKKKIESVKCSLIKRFHPIFIQLPIFFAPFNIFSFTFNRMFYFYGANDNSLKICFLKWRKNKITELHNSKKIYCQQKLSLTSKIFIKDKQILIFSLYFIIEK